MTEQGRPALRLAPAASETIRREVERAGGREVCFLASVGEDGTVQDPRAVARGNREAVLAVARDATEGGVMIHNHPSGALEPSPADLEVAARLFQGGLGTAITDNGARDLYVVVEPPAPRRTEPLDVERLEAVLSPGGNLARAHDGFEDRPGQREMLRAVAERYHEGGVAVVEAGTGTGKSLAYLLPAAAWALRNGERTVVSTATINLQEQLVGKDLPLVARLLGDGTAAGKEGGRGEEGRDVSGGVGDGGTGAPGGTTDAPEGAAATGEGGDGRSPGQRELRWSLVKGRGNYVSIRRARLAAQSAPELFPDDRSAELQAILEWLQTTEDGSLSDLSHRPSPEVWEEVRSDADICLRARCPHFRQCFFQRARREASSADLLVVNHHLLFSDLSVRKATDNRTGPAVLPPFRHLVLDEAHNTEDAATSHLGVEVSRRGLYQTLSRLDRGGKGVLATVAGRLRAEDDPEGRTLAARVDDRAVPRVAEARTALDRLMDVLEGLAPSGPGESRRLAPPGEEPPVAHPAVSEALAGAEAALRLLRREVAELRERVEDSPVWREILEGRVLDLRGSERRLEGAVHALRLVLDPGVEEAPHVRWIERREGRRKGSGNLALAAAPVEPARVLREDLFGRLDATVLTSATLTTRGRFDFLRERLGLGPPPGSGGRGPAGRVPAGEIAADARRGEAPPGPADPSAPSGEGEAGAAAEAAGPVPFTVSELRIPSPFDFASQTVLCVPTDQPGPAGGEAFDRATAERVAAFAGITGGGIFVLFTSHRSLRRVAAHLRADGAADRWPLLVHGEAPRSRLLSSFVDSGRGLLLGTASFWEGVDVPGRPLRGLVLQKLPFRVPTEPITQAREEVVRERGGNSFQQYALPLAALRLKQGFGRLVRSRRDRGAVVLLDDRIVTRPYGRYLRASLPGPPLVNAPWHEVVGSLERFYREGVPLRPASAACSTGPAE